MGLEKIEKLAWEKLASIEQMYARAGIEYDSSVPQRQVLDMLGLITGGIRQFTDLEDYIEVKVYIAKEETIKRVEGAIMLERGSLIKEYRRLKSDFDLAKSKGYVDLQQIAEATSSLITRVRGWEQREQQRGRTRTIIDDKAKLHVLHVLDDILGDIEDLQSDPTYVEDEDEDEDEDEGWVWERGR